MPMTKNDYRIHGKDLFVMGKPEPEAVVNASWQQRAIITGYARAKQWDTYGRKIHNKPRAFFQAEFVVCDETPDVFWERKTAEAEADFRDGDHGATEAIAQTSDGGFPVGTLPVMSSPEPLKVRNYAVQAATGQAFQEAMLENLSDLIPGGVEVGSGAFAGCVTIHTDDVAGAAKQIEETFKKTSEELLVKMDSHGLSIDKTAMADSLITLGVDRAKGSDSTGIVVLKGRKNGLNTIVSSYSSTHLGMTKAVDENKRKDSLHALTSHLKALELRSHECTDRAKKRKLEGKIARTLVALSHLQG